METTAANALFGYTGEHVCDYLARFSNVTIPQGATIDSAFIVLRCYTSESGTACNAVIHFDDVDSAAAFSTYAEYEGRDLTDSYVDWDSVPSMIGGQWYRTPDISSPVSEVTDRSGWSTGNAMAAFIKDNNSSSGAYRRTYQYDAESSSACSLVVHYSEAQAPETLKPRRRRAILEIARAAVGRRQLPRCSADRNPVSECKTAGLSGTSSHFYGGKR
jgi:hypothetical protein